MNRQSPFVVTFLARWAGRCCVAPAELADEVGPDTVVNTAAVVPVGGTDRVTTGSSVTSPTLDSGADPVAEVASRSRDNVCFAIIVTHVRGLLEGLCRLYAR